MTFYPVVALLSQGGGTLTGPITGQGTGINPLFGAGTVGDTFNRIELDADGVLRGGSGASPTDTGLSRSAAGVWRSSGTIKLAAGNLDVNAAGSGLQVAEGSNAKQGASALTAGTVTVANTSVTATSRIMITGNADGGTPGFTRCSGRTAGTSFTITSGSGTDTSTDAWEIFEQG